MRYVGFGALAIAYWANVVLLHLLLECPPLRELPPMPPFARTAAPVVVAAPIVAAPPVLERAPVKRAIGDPRDRRKITDNFDCF